MTEVLKDVDKIAPLIVDHTDFVVKSETGRPASVSYANTIIDGGCLRINSGTFTSLGYNLTSSCSPSPAASDVVISSSQLFTEVLEQDLKDNGGPTKTHALIARGRAVDAGYCPGETADQRGFARPVDDPLVANVRDACDIGAYELQGSVAAVADLMISQAVNKTSVKQGASCSPTPSGSRTSAPRPRPTWSSPTCCRAARRSSRSARTRAP